MENWHRDFPAIWCVFGGSYLNFKNAPDKIKWFDRHEKFLVDLLQNYLTTVTNETASRHSYVQVLTGINAVRKLLELWSEDLQLIYDIRQSRKESSIKQLARRFFHRVRTFQNCTVIPNGLISGGHTEAYESVNLAILKTNNENIDWIQVNPGGLYHQKYRSTAGDLSNAYFEISDINLHDISEDWFYLLVGLKAFPLEDGFYYKETSLYECLLAHLNGKTEFQSHSDDGFAFYNHSSPCHTWQVIEFSFRYLLQHFLGENFLDVHNRLITGFKLFLMKKTFLAYPCVTNELKNQHHFLLLEMCQHMALHVLSYGNEKQKSLSLELINAVKSATKRHCLQLHIKLLSFKLSEPFVSSLSFIPPMLINLSETSNSLVGSPLHIEPTYPNPGKDDDIIEYLKHFKSNFIDKLNSSNQFNDTVTLSCGIETFFLEYLVKTDILQESKEPFSRDDILLGNTLKDLAGIYYYCQGNIVLQFLSNNTYEPQFYAKNVVIQFFVYAAIAALNLRDKNIGPLLTKYNLSTVTSECLSLHKIIPYLVIHDARYLRVLLAVQEFFEPNWDKETLFSRFSILVRNNSNESDTDVAFAYKLLQNDERAHLRFLIDYYELEEEKFNQKWLKLTYSDSYLPQLYCLLSKFALFAKASLTGFQVAVNNNISNTISWYLSYPRYYYSHADFRRNGCNVSSTPYSNKLTSYLIKPSSYEADPYERLIVRRETIRTFNSNIHFKENEIIASQNKKPAKMDCVRFLHLGFLQSEPWLKLQRLYIAVKEQQLVFSCEQECMLIKQTLFEVSMLLDTDTSLCSLLEWTAQNNPLLIHKLGMLFVEKTLSMKYRLTQHSAIVEILEIILHLLTFYPPTFKDQFNESISKIYDFLRDILMEPPAHLSERTLLYLNAYLIISVRTKPELIKTETLMILKAYLAIQNYKVKGLDLENNVLFHIYFTNFLCGELIQNELVQKPNLLDDLMLSIIPQWEAGNMWTKDERGLLFTCKDYAVKPLYGMIYFLNKPVAGLPIEITQHKVFKDYFGKVRFAVIPASRKMNTEEETPCYLSVDNDPKVRLTLVKNCLLIEEWIENDYQLFHPAQQLLGHFRYPQLFFMLPNYAQALTHWSNNARKILVKNSNREVLYEWDLQTNVVFSLQHQGYIVPWEHLRKSNFKTWLEKIELPEWIEIIAEDAADKSVVNIHSLHFPRLGLHFDYKCKKFHSQQIHGYVISEQQTINILHGFSNYIVLENAVKYSSQHFIKLVIPHKEITPHGPFYSRTTKANLNCIKQPSYFVYDFDSKIDLLITNSISARLYLALLYYCSASLDDNDASHCNAYHLARENLEKCWKDQPYDKVELDIIEQLLSQYAIRDRHCCRITIYLKVVSLLHSSLRLSFLYTDQSSAQNTERSQQILRKCSQFSDFLTLYLQNKRNILQRIKLNSEEERDVRHFFRIVSSCSPKNYKRNYEQLFSRQGLDNTYFVWILESHINVLKFEFDTKKLNFSSGINGILIDRFRLMHFITLYDLAKSTTITVKKFCYLLHHTVLRANISYEFPVDLIIMLARAILLVLEHPTYFPESPSWYKSSYLSIDLSKRSIAESEVYNAFPKFLWRPLRIYETFEKETQAIKEARLKDENENKLIWSKFKYYDLNNQNVPLHLPINPINFSLKYERYVTFHNVRKREIVRGLYLEAARNDAMYQFFVNVLQKCDGLKYASKMGWVISEFIQKDISLTEETQLVPSPLPILNPCNLEKKAISMKPLDDFIRFFTVEQMPLKNQEFLFESQLQQPNEEQDGYQKEFYNELKSSWIVYHQEPSFSYFWKNSQSLDELEHNLHIKVTDINKQAKQKWSCIIKLVEQRPNSKSDHYFALRWHSGQVLHYHKADLLKLLIEPCKLANFNPTCLKDQHILNEDLLYYITCKIHAAKIIRVLSLIQQYKQTENQSEQISVLNCLVKNLQENIDPESYNYPHWLLFQFENNLIVRDNQRELIIDMLNQTEKAMYQLNMGEGKSSVILPLLSYNLANGKELLRINVLSSLEATMKNFLCQCFSGLIERHIYSLPFYRNTDISITNLTTILETLKICQLHGHILLVTPEHRMCLQLKVRELMLENQQQKSATDVFNWETYRQRAHCKVDVYPDLTEDQLKQLLAEQDKSLKKCLYDQNYIDQHDKILKVPPRGLGRKKFAQFKGYINNPMFREWSCLKAAYRELLFNSTLGHVDSSGKLSLLNRINSLPAIDLLDESDEILRHNTELNYTIGDKYVFDGEEFRWQIPQFLLQLVFCDPTIKQIVSAGKAEGLTDMNIHYNPRGGVPLIQLLSEMYYEKNIKPLLIENFILEYLPSFRKYGITADDSIVKGEESSLRSYIAGRLPLATEKKVVTYLDDKVQLKNKVLIAKGWLTHGILYHVLNAKYRVQYGLHIDLNGHLQKQIAIPYWGKDTPSQRSEFGHPDVMLGFTIISYLYHGLNEQQVKETLIRLKSKYNHQVADMHLRDWAESSRSWIEPQTDSFPPLLLMSFEHIDLADEQCLAQLHQYLSSNHSAIFFYLNQYVFLQEAMQYRTKISANAHSLVGFDPALGFSGTDDRKITMPFQIKSHRSTTQQGTNGKLLSVLTEERNSCYSTIQMDNTEQLLRQVCDYVKKQPLCHALIDAGALVTGLTNYEVASFLLANLPHVFLGILYFSDKRNSLTVLTRDRKIIMLQDCFLDKHYLFAYLDDIHTRGTDIKLPLNCQAVLTVGMGIEKDKLMQAAMRLRQLAEKQSVTLWGTQAVSFAIARDNCIDVKEINSYQVLKWVTHNTIEHINKDLFSVAVRKISFQFLVNAMSWIKEAPVPLNTLIKHCEEKEPFFLEEFYAATPQEEDLSDRLFLLIAAKIKTFWQELEEEMKSKELINSAFYKKILGKANKKAFRDCLDIICKELSIYLQTGCVHTTLDDDEEKEVEVEIIEEKEVLVEVDLKKPNTEKEWDVNLILQKNFIELAEEKNIIMPLSSIKHFIELPVNLKNIIWHPDIYMTENHIQSVKLEANDKLDNYLRPTDVVLIHRSDDKSTAVLLSGQEAAWIKNVHFNLTDNLLVHLYDMDGPTQLPLGHKMIEKELKMLTVIKLFAGECNYYSPDEVKWLSLHIGRVYDSYFESPGANIDCECSKKVFELLIKKGYLDFAGFMTEKLLNILHLKKDGESPSLPLGTEYKQYESAILEKLFGIYTVLIIKPVSFKESHNALWQWIGTRGRMKDYSGSKLESIINPECQLKY